MIDEWIRSTGVRYFSELTNMAILTEEVGEVARLMSRIYGDQSFREVDKDKKLSDELADVLWVILCIANQTGTDLTEAFRKNFDKKNTRDAKRHLENSKLNPEKSRFVKRSVCFKVSARLFSLLYSYTRILVLLSLRQAIRFLAIHHIQEFEGSDFKITAEAYIKTDNILLYEGRTINTFKSRIVLIYQIRIYRTRRPYLCSAVADINQAKFNTTVAFAFLGNDFRLFRAFDEHIHSDNIFLLIFGII